MKVIVDYFKVFSGIAWKNWKTEHIRVVGPRPGFEQGTFAMRPERVTYSEIVPVVFCIIIAI